MGWGCWDPILGRLRDAVDIKPKGTKDPNNRVPLKGLYKGIYIGDIA